MQVYANLHSTSVSAIKESAELKDSYEQWKKLKYRLTSSVSNYILAHQVPEAEYGRARDIISRSTITELQELTRTLPELKSGALKFDQWLDISGGSGRSEIKIIKRTPVISEKKKATVKIAPSPADKALKQEIDRTVRLINAHRRQGYIKEEMRDERIAKVKAMTVKEDVAEYRESIKLNRAPVKRSKISKSASSDEDTEECDELVRDDETDDSE